MKTSPKDSAYRRTSWPDPAGKLSYVAVAVVVMVGDRVELNERRIAKLGVPHPLPIGSACDAKLKA